MRRRCICRWRSCVSVGGGVTVDDRPERKVGDDGRGDARSARPHAPAGNPIPPARLV